MGAITMSAVNRRSLKTIDLGTAGVTSEGCFWGCEGSWTEGEATDDFSEGMLVRRVAIVKLASLCILGEVLL